VSLPDLLIRRNVLAPRFKRAFVPACRLVGTAVALAELPLGTKDGSNEWARSSAASALPRQLHV
jgi:hypothetical protein